MNIRSILSDLENKFSIINMLIWKKKRRNNSHDSNANMQGFAYIRGNALWDYYSVSERVYYQ